jgi:hypothetical protein
MITSVVISRMHSSLLKPLRLICVFVLTLILSACSSTSTTIIDEEVVTNPKPMYKYKSLVIRDFDLKSDVFAAPENTDPGSRENRYARLPGELSGHIERYAKARRTYNSISRDGQLSATTLVVKGRFTRVGRFRISVVASLHDGATDQEVAYFRQTLWDVIDTTETISNLGREVADFIDRIQYK